MIAPAVHREFLSPPQVARLLGVDAHKVLVWVRSGEAGAVAGRLEREAAGWARVMAVPFAARGVEVVG